MRERSAEMEEPGLTISGMSGSWCTPRPLGSCPLVFSMEALMPLGGSGNLKGGEEGMEEERERREER